MKKKILILLLINSFVFSNCYSLDFNNIYKVKTFSATNLEINDTNLVDQEHAGNLIEYIKDLNVAVVEESEKIKDNNKNRKIPKFKGAEDIYSDYANSVVFIKNWQKGEWVGSGSGFVINYKGLKIITNWHVIEDAEKIDVYLKPKNKLVDESFSLSNETIYKAKVIKINERKDLAMLEVVKLPLKTKPVNYGKFKKVKIGETLFAIGHPEGLLWSFSSGMVSQIRPNYDWKYRNSYHHANVIQIQVPINPGNSGGPLFNKNKELVGVNTFTAEGENLNFAVSVDDIVDFLNEKIKKTKKKDIEWIKRKKNGPTWIKKKEKKSLNNDSIDLSGAVEADMNNNGVIDAWLIDENKNGVYEIAYGDTNENGIIDVLVVDKNENKIYEFTFIDTDEDGNPDLGEYDKDEDGETDVLAYDYDQDGEWDKFENL